MEYCCSSPFDICALWNTQVKDDNKMFDRSKKKLREEHDAMDRVSKNLVQMHSAASPILEFEYVRYPKDS